MIHSSHSERAGHGPLDREALSARLVELWEGIGDVRLDRLARGEAPHAGASIDTEQDYHDWVSTCLMDCYKNTGDPACFALLFELNRASFLHAVQSKLRRSFQQVDAQDVLQEVFLNIYRYPHRFHADKADAFRGWGHRIARNTLLKFLKGQTRLSQFLDLDEEVVQPEDLRTRRPDRVASEAEDAAVVDRAYLIYLQLYLLHFTRLSAKERRALTLVEVEGTSYRDAAADLGIRLENLKMVVFRGRRKILRGMEQSLTQLGASTASNASAHAASDTHAVRRTRAPESGVRSAGRSPGSGPASCRNLAPARLPELAIGDHADDEV